MKNHNSGFTLIELMVVVIIIAVLAAMAIPTFRNAVENSREREARSVLELIYSAEKAYRVDTKKYANAFSDLTSYIEDPSNGAFYTFSINSPDANSFEAQAVRDPSKDNGDGRTFKINESGQIYQ